MAVRAGATSGQIRFITVMVREVGGIRADEVFREITGRDRYALPMPDRYETLTRAQVGDLIARLREITGRS